MTIYEVMKNLMEMQKFYQMNTEKEQKTIRCAVGYLENLMRFAEKLDGTGVTLVSAPAPTSVGVMVEGDKLEISVQPYLPEELAAAYHAEELQGSCRTVMDVALFRKGIGGDDSWGAPVLPQYTYASNKSYTLTFTMKAL